MFKKLTKKIIKDVKSAVKEETKNDIKNNIPAIIGIATIGLGLITYAQLLKEPKNKMTTIVIHIYTMEVIK